MYTVRNIYGQLKNEKDYLQKQNFVYGQEVTSGN